MKVRKPFRRQFIARARWNQTEKLLIRNLLAPNWIFVQTKDDKCLGISLFVIICGFLLIQQFPALRPSSAIQRDHLVTFRTNPNYFSIWLTKIVPWTITARQKFSQIAKPQFRDRNFMIQPKTTLDSVPRVTWDARQASQDVVCFNF